MRSILFQARQNIKCIVATVLLCPVGVPLKKVYNIGKSPSRRCHTSNGNRNMTENEARIEELVHTRLPDLVLFAKQWKHSPAEDIVQEAFLKLMKQATKQKGFPDNPVAWLYTTVRNLSNNEHRSHHRRKRRELEVQTGKCLFEVPDTEQKEEVEQLIRKLESLDLEYREVIVAKIWGGLTFEEIAEVTGASRSAVHRKWQEGIRRLRE